MKNQWTGGQYSLFRVILAAYLFCFFAYHLVAGSSSGGVGQMLAMNFMAPISGTVLDGLALGLCSILGLGWRDKWAAWVLFFLYPIVPDRELFLPLISPVHVLFLIHVFNPGVPYGAFAARGRTDPGGGWTLPPLLFGAAWFFLAANSISGAVRGAFQSRWWHGEWPQTLFSETGAGQRLAAEFSAVGTPLGYVLLALLLLWPLAFCKASWRPALWTVLFLLNLVLGLLGMTSAWENLIFLCFAFDPGWLAFAENAPREHVFFDGYCGLCHRTTRLIVAEDRDGAFFQMAPLQGETFKTLVAKEVSAELPDSLIVRKDNGQLLVKSTASLYIAARLGGYWRILSILGGMAPKVVRDVCYDGIARMRRRLFKQPEALCPLMPADLRDRFGG